MCEDQSNNKPIYKDYYKDYADYAVLIPYFDESWTVRRRKDSDFDKLQLKSGYNFAQTCKQYREDVENNNASLNKSNGYDSNSMDNYILNPACYVAFGQTDGVGIVILDDFSPIFSITGDFSTTIDHSCLTFCPTLEALGLGKDKTPFCEIHDLLNKPFPDLTKQSKFSAHINDSDNELPLMVITEFKLNALAVLDLGLEGRMTIFKAMAHKIQETVGNLKEQVKDEHLHRLIDEDDIEKLKCVLLDAQGTTDIVLLTFCKNYSVATSLVTALRSMDFKPLKPQCDGELHRNALKKIKELNKKDDDRDWGDMHIFYSTYSTLTFTYEFVLEHRQEEAHSKLVKQCRGFAKAYGLFKIKAGHCKTLNEKISSLPEYNSKIQEFSMDDENYHLLLTGQYDRIEDLSQGEDVRYMLPVNVLIGLLIDLLTELKGNLSDISTSIATPVLTGTFCQKISKNHMNTSEFYLDMHNKLFIDERGPFNIKELHKSLRVLRIPIPLCRSVVYLYQVFANCFADPLLFNNALELYNVFDTIYNLLTKHYINKQKELTDNHQIETRVNEKEIKALCRLLEIIRDALDVKTNLALPGDRKRDMAIDFRGGLNKLMDSADVLVQCGTELFNQTIEYCDLKNEDNQCYVGIIKQINFDPQTNFYQLNLGSDKHILACIDMNASHLFNPAYSLDYFHEIGYMIFDYLLRKKRFKDIKNDTNENKDRKNDEESFIEQLFNPQHKDSQKTFFKAMRERLREVFADLLTHLFIFGSDTDGFIQYYLIRYTTLPLSIHQEYDKQLIRLNEVMFRAFLIDDAVKQLKEDSNDPLDWEYESYDNKHPYTQKSRPFLNDFNTMFEKYKPYVIFPQDDKRYKYLEDEYKQYREKTFMHLYFWISWKCMKPLLRESLGVYEHCVKSDDDATRHIKKIGKIIRGYIKCYYEIDKDKKMHLYRDPQSGKVNYEKIFKENNNEKWNEIQLDPQRGGLFCANPDRRRQQIKYQITALRDLWDISTKQLAASQVKMMSRLADTAKPDEL